MADNSYLVGSSRCLFVTGTDTEVGKTIVSAALVHGLAQTGQDWVYWKPVQSGTLEIDSQTVQKLAGPDRTTLNSSYVYEKPASPNQSARANSQDSVELKRLSDDLRSFLSNKDPSGLLIEGAGGLLVPLNEDFASWQDWLETERLPCLLVARSGLGTLNHTAMSLKLLESSQIPIVGVVLNGPRHEDNLADLKAWFPHISFFAFEFCDSLDSSSSQWQQQSASLAQWLLTQYAKVLPNSSFDVWQSFDQKHCWHPYTQHKTSQAPLAIVRAKGVWLEDQSGKRYLDGISSWWTNTIGHGHPAIGKAIYHQQQALDHTLYAGVCHQPASELAAKLSELSRHQLPRVFYSDNGSCAVEVALKIALQRWQQRGEPQRKKIMSFRGSYHGDTFGAMAVAASDDFHHNFRDLMFSPLRLTPATAHSCSYNPAGPESVKERVLELEQAFLSHQNELACVIIEPMVQGASGMNIQDLSWLKRLSQLCEQHQVPLILDEVFTGMGRFGSPLVYQRADIKPAMVCLAKGLTGGNLPLAATLVDETIFQDFYSDEPGHALYHGHTYTANPIACQAALASLAIYEKEQLMERGLQLEAQFQTWLDRHSATLGLENARCYGGMMAWELPGTGSGDYFHPIAKKLAGKALERGMLLRPLGNTLYFLPALTINRAELEFAFAAIEQLMKDLA